MLCQINQQHINLKTISVAIAVLTYGDKFLLATRHTHQHQGGKLEFVGGKINKSESPVLALVRELQEELGLDVAARQAVKMGRICHRYEDRAVQLHVFLVELNDTQYDSLKNQRLGKENQPLTWLDFDELVAVRHRLPAANQPILTWLTLPKVVAISHELAAFDTIDDCIVTYQSLPAQTALYLRLKCDKAIEQQVIYDISQARADVPLFLPLQSYKSLPEPKSSNILAVCLTQDELMACCADDLVGLPPIMASCHDGDSVMKLNQLSEKITVLGAFVSPVQPTATHPDAAALGFEKFGKLARFCNVPVMALGGLAPSDLALCQRYGAWGVSGIRSFIKA
ncbi:NUDIX domain-containing protein [Moraxella nasovis]|uniref:NUDIX domain-containing protein n=1 Tax=Moraxella nasovis TaxID=2904121 RepID=UPI001F625279|nr:NUDIX domain-containing protein [Moraxella nasovis]UNU73513.1 NUDIX domain-containing protein [Moraxella nasovis]